MKPGLQVGTEGVVDDIVTDDMRAAFGGSVVHPVYGTVAMVYHMEWAARRVILPYLDDHEEGIGTGVRVRHINPAPVGVNIRTRAVCTAFDGQTVVCDVQVFHGKRLLGDGQVEQRIIPRATLHERFAELWDREGGE